MNIEGVREALRRFGQPVGNTLGLSKLPEHFDVLVLSSLAFWAVQVVLSPLVSSALVGKYKQFNARQRNNWNVHVVALVHALVIVPLAWRCLDSPTLNEDKAYGWDDRAGTVQAIACGYFLWDTLESIYHFSDIGFVVHGLACFLIYGLAFQPFIAYFGPRFLLWELSTPFLNIHWFIDKLDKTGSRLQLINGLLLLSTFAGARLVFGPVMSYDFFNTLKSIKNDVSMLYIVVYGGGNVVLNTLNCIWFFKMIRALQKRLVGPKVNGHNSNGLMKPNGNGIKANGNGVHVNGNGLKSKSQ